MKLLLVNPVDPSGVGLTANPKFRFQPLGLAIVAALTPSGWDIEIADENFGAFTYQEADRIVDCVRQKPPFGPFPEPLVQRFELLWIADHGDRTGFGPGLGDQNPGHFQRVPKAAGHFIEVDAHASFRSTR